jgi:hypothetical protein
MAMTVAPWRTDNAPEPNDSVATRENGYEGHPDEGVDPCSNT